MDRVEKVQPLLSLIKKYESDGAVNIQKAESSYDVVWGGIKTIDRPSKLSNMTVKQVLDWQDSIDSKYNSEAAGAFQIMEDTLRSLKYDPNALFNKSTQDALALQLLDRRGWSKVEDGSMSVTSFANAMAKEWASFPVQQKMQGRFRTVERGQSYYAGDGLNAAHAKPEEVIDAINKSLSYTPPVVVEEDPLKEIRERLENLEQWAEKLEPWLKRRLNGKSL